MAFSATVKSPMKGAERVSRSLGVYAGQVTVSSYATTLVELTAITKYFKAISHTNATAALFPHGIVSVNVDGVSELGFAFRWDATTGAFQCYTPTNITVSGSATGANLTIDLGIPALQAVSTQGLYAVGAIEAIANDAPGTVNFVAIGFI